MIIGVIVQGQIGRLICPVRTDLSVGEKVAEKWPVPTINTSVVYLPLLE